MDFQDIQTIYADLLYRFVVGLMHDEIEAHAIVALCFKYLQNNINAIKDETTARICLENTARKLSLNYINKKAADERNSDPKRACL